MRPAEQVSGPGGAGASSQREARAVPVYLEEDSGGGGGAGDAVILLPHHRGR